MDFLRPRGSSQEPKNHGAAERSSLLPNPTHPSPLCYPQATHTPPKEGLLPYSRPISFTSLVTVCERSFREVVPLALSCAPQRGRAGARAASGRLSPGREPPEHETRWLCHSRPWKPTPPALLLTSEAKTLPMWEPRSPRRPLGALRVAPRKKAPTGVTAATCAAGKKPSPRTPEHFEMIMWASQRSEAALRGDYGPEAWDPPPCAPRTPDQSSPPPPTLDR